MTQAHKVRLTLEMDSDAHAQLKMACALLGVTMREFILRATFEKIENFEDRLLVKKAHETLKRIESGEEKTLSWKKLKKDCI